MYTETVRQASGKQRQGRPKTANPKSVVIPVRVSEAKAAMIDDACGGTARSVWVEAAIDAELARIAAEDERQQAAAERRRQTTADAGSPGRCTHPGTRVIGGYCKTCGHLTDPGGYWRD